MYENTPDWVQSLYQTSKRQETGRIDQEALFVHVFTWNKSGGKGVAQIYEVLEVSRPKSRSDSFGPSMRGIK